MAALPFLDLCSN